MTIYPNVGALILATDIGIQLESSELGLYKEIASPLSVSTKLSDLTVCNFSGYSQPTIVALGVPYLDPAGGSTIATPSHQFNFATPAPPALPVTNVVLGWFFVNSSNKLVVVGSFDAPIAMAADGDAIPLQVLLNFCRN